MIVSRASFDKRRIAEHLSEVHDPEIAGVEHCRDGNCKKCRIQRRGSSRRDHADLFRLPCYESHRGRYYLQLSGPADTQMLFVNTVYSPAWTTNWLSSSTKEKLKAYGIAPPEESAGEVIVLLPTIKETVSCPFCGTNETEVRSEFGSTACKSIHYCNNCRQPFEHLKEI